ERLDAFRRPARLEQVLAACSADWRGRQGSPDKEYPQAVRIGRAQAVASAVDAGRLAALGGGPDQIRERIHQHRVEAVAQALDA
ncbi:MAG: multifunctional CCA tRNA nucleotidyl transferase/2'3'-cyclic phosphodiesterase/2'nucleotidase/phosphatase, partial [Quisquiliibacterium sp.]